MSYNFFKQQLEIGKTGEAAVAEFMRSRNHTVIDVSDDAEYQKKDIDFLLTSPTGEKCSIEVKTDYKIHKTGNFFFEGVYHKDWGDSNGWFDYCEADYICFLDAVEYKLYIFDYKNGKEIIQTKGEKKYFYNSDDGCDRECYLVPIWMAKKYNLITNVFDLREVA